MKKIKISIILISLITLGAGCAGISSVEQSDGGFWVSEDNGATWKSRSNIYADKTSQKTINGYDIKKIIFSPSDPRKIYVITEKNGLWISWNSGYNWDMLLSSPNINDIAIEKTNPKKIYAAIGGNIVSSEDEGVKWKTIYTSDSNQVAVVSLAIDPDKQNIIYASSNKGVIIISENYGISWKIYSDLGKNTILKNIEFHDSEQGAAWAYDDRQGLAKSKDKGKSWEFFEIKGAPRDFELGKSVIMYASSVGLFKSIDFGKTWTELPLISGKDEANIYSIAINSKDEKEIFYGTKSVLYYSSDGGLNWIPRSLPSSWAAGFIDVHQDYPKTVFLGAKRFK